MQVNYGQDDGVIQWFIWNVSTKYIPCGLIYTTKGVNSMIPRRSEKDRIKLCDMKI